MMLPSLYKYTNFLTALAIVKSEAFRFNSPISFNDPFDVQRRCIFERSIGGAIDDFFVEFEHLATSNVSIKNVRKQWRVMLKTLRPLVKQRGYKKAELESQLYPLMRSSMPSDDDLEQIKTIVEECITNWLEPIRVFCLSEDWNIVLMWSHYANNHTGVVFEISPHRGKLFPQTDVRKVAYKRSPHIMFDRKTLIKAQLYGARVATRKMKFDDHLFRKASFWSYEKEWRAILKTKKNHVDQFIDVPFKWKQISSITFGCMCTVPEIDEFKAACGDLASKVAFFRCVQSDDQYGLTRVPA